MIFDSHCHLDPRTYGGDAGVDAVVATARAAGVRYMLTVGSGYGDGSAERAVAVAKRHEGVWASVGMHPHDAKELDEAVHARLVELAAEPEVVAWGEIGLDFFYDNSPRDQQREALRWQIRTALALDLPIIIHDRDSFGETQAILEEEGAYEGAGVLYHCYAGGPDRMRRICELGGYISIPGTVTWSREEVLRGIAAEVPLDRMLVETDAPFLTPEPLRGCKNEPCHVALTLDFIAGLRGMRREELAWATTANTCRLFRISL
ncbi:MAG: TatD family hydrolase [Alphaproteobacteria bacterium]|nr:TatD family hydrolase [Alphaproteobacteria bacterium]MCB9792579.1 TatD family hydrolase [Alphaproteobacteria bacterium]